MNDLKILSIVLIIFEMLCLICLGIVSGCNAISCSQIGKALSYKTEWHFWTGCVVEKPDGSRVLLNQIRDVEK